MNTSFEIPNGEETVMVELTVKEAMALSGGIRFRPESKVALNAKKKVQKVLESKMMPNSDRIHYHSLDV
ncbi:hypothetical protein FE784_29380 [Paenibacillus hemerocallicola]|jgi:hypothetical protein|uniref:Uncharacterized protein n=1 Tax=Paenibacillus hemerocallicola TaxID=1172614 RepID=A0A5C4T1E1_9BACL|nr:hypothetical protein [Paenibacillus hemerocallicola]TNJ62756.1 hypothetical protein FE784_29380 [Paenibacillus hemerocallicola]